MACTRCERTGTCSHTQCPFLDVTGLECVEVVDNFCEAGEECVKECEWSYPASKHDEAVKAFKDAYPEEE